MSLQCTVEAAIILEVKCSPFSCQDLGPRLLILDHVRSEILETFRTEDFDIEYRSANRFRFMGSGRTLKESRGEYYVLN